MLLNNKYEIYVPNSYNTPNGVLKFDSDEYESHLNNIIKLLLLDCDLSGVSIRDESGYYRLSDGTITSMSNKVIYFYSNSEYSKILRNIVFYIRSQMKQYEVMIVTNGVAEIRSN